MALQSLTDPRLPLPPYTTGDTAEIDELKLRVDDLEDWKSTAEEQIADLLARVAALEGP